MVGAGNFGPGYRQGQSGFHRIDDPDLEEVVRTEFLTRIIAKATQYNPVERYADVGELKAALEDIDSYEYEVQVRARKKEGLSASANKYVSSEKKQDAGAFNIEELAAYAAYVGIGALGFAIVATPFHIAYLINENYTTEISFLPFLAGAFSGTFIPTVCKLISDTYSRTLNYFDAMVYGAIGGAALGGYWGNLVIAESMSGSVSSATEYFIVGTVSVIAGLFGGFSAVKIKELIKKRVLKDKKN